MSADLDSIERLKLARSIMAVAKKHEESYDESVDDYGISISLAAQQIAPEIARVITAVLTSHWNEMMAWCTEQGVPYND